MILVGAMMPLSTAMAQTGAAQADGRTASSRLVGDAGPRALLAGLFVLTAILGQLISNTATALIIIPIARRGRERDRHLAAAGADERRRRRRGRLPDADRDADQPDGDGAGRLQVQRLLEARPADADLVLSSRRSTFRSSGVSDAWLKIYEVLRRMQERFNCQ